MSEASTAPLPANLSFPQALTPSVDPGSHELPGRPASSLLRITRNKGQNQGENGPNQAKFGAVE